MLDAAYGGIFSYADEAIAILLVLWRFSPDVGRRSVFMSAEDL